MIFKEQCKVQMLLFQIYGIVFNEHYTNTSTLDPNVS